MIKIEPTIKRHVVDLYRRSDFSMNEIAKQYGVSKDYVASVRDKEKLEREAEPYTVLKINSSYLEDALKVLREYEIRFSFPSKDHELIEYYQSSINQ